MAVTINQGTQTSIKTTTDSGEIQHVRNDGGTVGVVSSVANLDAGTVTALESLPDLPGGTVDALTSVANVVKGTVTRVEGGSVVVTALPDPVGSVVVTAGTVGDLDTVGTVGVVEGGTLAQVTVVPNVTNVDAGTITRIEGGTIGVVSSVAALPDPVGSVVVTAGTSVGGASSGAAASGNPLPIAGTDSGGTVYSMLVDTAGNPQVDAVSLPDLPGGTVDLVTTLSNVTNLDAGTVSALESLPDLPGGTVDLVTTVTTVTDVTDVSNLTKGTITEVEGGTLDQVTVVPNITNLDAGTVTALESLPDLPGGTVDLVSQANVTIGTFGADLPGGTVDLVSQANVTVGTFSADIPGGTVDAVSNVAGGTVVTDGIQFRHADEFATVVSSGTTTLGTIKAAVGGSVIYVTDLIISAADATNVEIASGGTSTGIVGTLHFGTQGGISAPNFKVYPRTASGSALVYKQSANVALSITANGYVD